MIWIAGAFVLGEVAAYLADGATAEGTGMPFFLPALFFIAGAALPAAAYLRTGEGISKKAAGRILILFLLFLSGAFRMHGAMAKEPAEQLLEENGIANYKTFGKVFREMYGFSPREIRKMV